MLTRTFTNQRPGRVLIRSISGALFAAAILVAALGAGSTAIEAKGSKGEEIPLLVDRTAPRVERTAAPDVTSPIP